MQNIETQSSTFGLMLQINSSPSNMYSILNWAVISKERPNRDPNDKKGLFEDLGFSIETWVPKWRPRFLKRDLGLLIETHLGVVFMMRVCKCILVSTLGRRVICCVMSVHNTPIRLVLACVATSYKYVVYEYYSLSACTIRAS